MILVNIHISFSNFFFNFQEFCKISWNFSSFGIPAPLSTIITLASVHNFRDFIVYLFPLSSLMFWYWGSFLACYTYNTYYISFYRYYALLCPALFSKIIIKGTPSTPLTFRETYFSTLNFEGIGPGSGLWTALYYTPYN